MALNSFQRFVETELPNALREVDLLQLSKEILGENVESAKEYCKNGSSESIPKRIWLAMDGECCLDRLYGGYYSDWVCGGDWSRMCQFLKTFFDVAEQNNIEITVFFNGALEAERFNDWVKKQENRKAKVHRALFHTCLKKSTPSKKWWTEPACLHSSLRLFLRQLKVRVVVTKYDHHLEVITHMKKFNYHGLLADDSDYIFFDPPRYFSASQMKLTYKGKIITKEMVLSDVAELLHLSPSRMYVVAALLGNHILKAEDLKSFHCSLCPDYVPSSTLIRAVVDFVGKLESVDDLTEVATKVFESPGHKIEKFKQCVYYYCKGCLRTEAVADQPQAVAEEVENDLVDSSLETNEVDEKEDPSLPETKSDTNTHISDVADLSYMMTKVFCNVPESQAVDETKKSTDEEKSSASGPSFDLSSMGTHSNLHEVSEDKSTNSANNEEIVEGVFIDNASVPVYDPVVQVPVYDPVLQVPVYDPVLQVPVYDPVVQKARERHCSGIMHPFIYQILSQREIKIPVIMEDDSEIYFPSSVEIYKPIRQMVYGLLFNLHQPPEGIIKAVPDIIIKESVWTRSNRYAYPEFVPACPVPGPSIDALWFCRGQEASHNRLKAFLLCMRCDISMIFDFEEIPPQYLVLCCVLRYLMSGPELYLRENELDAFLATAVDPNLGNCNHILSIPLPSVQQRGVMLAALFMEGVDHAMLANDACGSPLDWIRFSPWLFFEGKIFHNKFIKSYFSHNVSELCDDRHEEVSLIDRMRSVITQGLSLELKSEYSTTRRIRQIQEFERVLPVPYSGRGGWIRGVRNPGVPSGYLSFRGNSRGRPFGRTHQRFPRASSNSSSTRGSPANIYLGMGRGAPNPKDSQTNGNNLGFQL